MYKLVYFNILFTIILINNSISYGLAQETAKNNLYFSFSVGAGELFFPRTNGQLQVCFPYTSTDQAGNTTKNIFTSTAINSYAKRQVMGGFNLELGTVRNFIEARFYTANNSANVSAGYGYNLYFDLFKNEKRSQKEKTFVIKYSINIDFSNYTNWDGRGNATDYNYLGSIDNENKTINLLGFTSNPTYTYYDGFPYYTRTPHVVNTKNIIIFYTQNDWVVIPKISLTNNPYKHLLHCEVEVEYFLPLREKGGIQLFQNGTNAMTSGVLGLNESSYTTTFNNKVITSNPYKFHGFFIGLTIGINISSETIHRHK